MDIHVVPMFLAGILCLLLSITTWILRRRENINKVFAIFTFALALDSFAFFSWYQFGSVEQIHTWMRVIFAAGFTVPTGLIFFLYAFTGFDSQKDVKVLGVKTWHFKIASLLFVLSNLIMAIFTDWVMEIPENPVDIWDTSFGVLGPYLFPLYGIIFFYLFTMAVKSYRKTQNKPQKQFILMLSIGTGMWLIFGYTGAIIFPITSNAWLALSYIGTSFMGIFYFVAILNYQSDKLVELNLNLERKVEERTQHLRETQAQLVQSEKTAALGHLVAGVAHEMNTPVGAVYSTHDTLAKASVKLQKILEEDYNVSINDSRKLSNIFNAISGVSDVIGSSGQRISDIVKQLKTFAQLDEADLQKVSFNECIDTTIEMFSFHLKPGIKIKKEYSELQEVTCFPAKINQLCFQLLRNANRAIENDGEIIVKTKQNGSNIEFSISDDGRGIKPEHLKKIFNPGFTAWDLNVGTGLGLAICYQIAQEHNGTITAHSENGNGSSFILSFPMKLHNN